MNHLCDPHAVRMGLEGGSLRITVASQFVGSCREKISISMMWPQVSRLSFPSHDKVVTAGCHAICSRGVGMGQHADSSAAALVAGREGSTAAYGEEQ